MLSTQVLQELCFNLRRKAHPPVSAEETRRLIRDYLSWEIVVSSFHSVIQALDMELRYKVSFWDALILQAAEACGATVVYSEDLAASQRYNSILRVNIVNPFTDSGPVPSPSSP